MFTEEARNWVRDRLLQRASNDRRVVAAAVVGSLALGGGDRWSDLDLSFGVANEVPLQEVLEDWTRWMVAEFDATQLFDLASGASIYRVFLLPGCLQCDVSFTPAAQFGATSARFRLVFGTAVEKAHLAARPAGELFGWAVHHALRARVCLERGRFWEGEYWVSNLRDYALSLACRRRGLATTYGRGFDDLPAEVRAEFVSALPTSLAREELLQALRAGIDALLRESAEAEDLGAKLEPQLRELMQ